MLKEEVSLAFCRKSYYSSSNGSGSALITKILNPSRKEEKNAGTILINFVSCNVVLYYVYICMYMRSHIFLYYTLFSRISPHRYLKWRLLILKILYYIKDFLSFAHPVLCSFFVIIFIFACLSFWLFDCPVRTLSFHCFAPMESLPFFPCLSCLIAIINITATASLCVISCNI